MDKELSNEIKEESLGTDAEMLSEIPQAEQEKPEEPEELTEMFVQKRKTVTVSDIITMQAILCVVLSIAYMVVNIFFPGISEEIYNEYRINVRAGTNDGLMGELAEKVIEFINSTPREYD